MTKNVIIALLSLALLAAISHKNSVSIPELVDGNLYSLRAFGYEVGIISTRWDDSRVIFAITGVERDGIVRGKITQIAGPRIASYAPYDCSTYYVYCYARDTRENWQGWVEFRGHRRPMCGGIKPRNPCLMMEY